MILATYQPFPENVDINKGGDWTELEEYLGYKPIFCFPARDQKEILTYSILAAPNCPDKLIIFETDEYDEIDIIQWNRRLAIKYQNEKNNLGMDEIPIEKCFTNKNSTYKEFIVKEIKNVIAEIDVENSFFSNFITEDGKDEDLLNYFNEVVKMTRDKVQEAGKFTINEDPSKNNYTKIQKIYLKNYFQWFLLPLIYTSIYKQDIVEAIHFDLNKYINEYGSLKVGQFYNDDEKLKYKTYQFYDDILRNISACCRETYGDIFRDNYLKMKHPKKIQPNEPCPCGSGKKYKKCCGRR